MNLSKCSDSDIISVKRKYEHAFQLETNINLKQINRCNEIVNKDNNTDDKIVNQLNLFDKEDEFENFYLKEFDLGITEYLNKQNGFNGIIKQRYSDFLVNEINSSQEIIYLTNFDYIENKQDHLFEKILSKDHLTKLSKLNENNENCEEYLIEASDNKQKRTLIHKEIGNTFPNLQSKTILKDGCQYISVSHSLNVKNTIWSENRKNYCKFVLYKENKSTLEALNCISQMLHTKLSVFTYAGTKDRRAKTTQEVTAYRVEPSRLMKLNDKLINVKIGNLKLCKDRLCLGELHGNLFKIVLRNVTGSDNEIENAMSSLRDNGFINYYGMQRFGTTSIKNYLIGMSLIRSNWEEAVNLILKPRTNEIGNIHECRKIWNEQKNAQKALEALMNFYCIEKDLLKGIIKNPGNYLMALSSIPLQMRLMYVHSYQSFVFNRIASKRIKKFGLKVVKGDLVQTTLNKDILTIDENANDFKITDVVLPLPGYDIKYPIYNSENWYNELFLEDNLDNFNFKHKIREYSLPGSYRKLIVHPENMIWSKVFYNDSKLPLVSSDLDKLQGRKIEENQLSNGEFKSIIFEFNLPSSSYATMVLREIFKQDTSTSFQTTLNCNK